MMARLRPWLPPAIALLLVVAAAAFLNHQHRQLTEAQRSVEALQLEKAGQIVAHQESAKDLQAQISALTMKNGDLAASLAAARAAAPGAQAVHAATLSTGAVVVQTTPALRDDPTAPVVRTGAATAGRGVQVAQNGEPVAAGADGRAPSEKDGVQHPATMAPAATQPQACVLSNGDRASIEVQQVTLKTVAGNFLVVGTAQAYREDQGGRALLFGGAFQSALSESSGLAPPVLPRWGAGLTGSCSGSGCSLGPALAFPPIHVLGLQLEATAGLQLGAGGVALTGTAIARF